MINHREDIKPQINILSLDIPPKYLFITHSKDTYLAKCAEVTAPFGKVCSIFHGKILMYGTKYMARSLLFARALLGTKQYYGVDPDSHGNIIKI